MHQTVSYAQCFLNLVNRNLGEKLYPGFKTTYNRLLRQYIGKQSTSGNQRITAQFIMKVRVAISY